MRKLIILGGVLAAGKSTFSRLIGEKFGVTVVNKDNLKEILGDTIRVDTREDNLKLSVVSFNLMSYLVEKNYGTLVLESNFKAHELKDLKAQCERLGYEVMSLIFDADNDVLHSRFIKRLSENRHYVHKSQDFSKIEDFIPTLDALRGLEYFGEIINVDATSFEYQKDTSLFDKIEAFIKK